MKHFGDITKLHGWKIPMTTVICGGSPCQDLSCAGKRAGFHTENGELTRSGLYMEQCRIIREMLDVSDGMYPRFHVWENVAGALTSSKGADFAAVLEETVKVKYPDIPAIPIPAKGWPTAGYITVGDISVAWRLHDSRFWGCPQRRRRLCVLTDYQSYKAAELLFGEPHSQEDYAPAKGKKKGAIVLELRPNLLGEWEWAEDTSFPIYSYNITEQPDCGQTYLWDRETGRYTSTESLLSNILSPVVALKYYLSKKACEGILSRAERRGKVLPEELRIALEQQIERIAAGKRADGLDD